MGVRQFISRRAADSRRPCGINGRAPLHKPFLFPQQNNRREDENMKRESSFVKGVRIRAQEKYGTSDEEYELCIRIKKAITCFRRGKLLDVGTERGTTAEKLVKMGFSVTAVDVDKLSVQKARKRGIKAFQIDVQEEALPFHDRYFNTVWAGEIIEHLIDPLNFFPK
jgi:2-polyprenyl-3-methyl-5-hydroxy-6-metoxy-1,4-benzoquinol methylase